MNQGSDLIGLLRGEAAVRGLPPARVEEWIRLGRPAAYAADGGEGGPVVVRLGGDALLPDDAPAPAAQFVAEIDCALLPAAATDLPLPADGRLLLFADPDVSSEGIGPGLVAYVPAGTPTQPRPLEADWPGKYPERRLCTLWHQLCWPDEDHADETASRFEAAWSHVVGHRPDWILQIGGHPNIVNWDPVEAARDEAASSDDAEHASVDPGDWVLLATWKYGEDIQELDWGLIHWVITRKDLEALRFDRVYLYVDMC